jgi:hypothetical protein
MQTNFEAAGNLDEWPPNVPGKPTQAAVFGVRGGTYEILWTGQFPDLEPAMYWAAKKELQAIKKGKWPMASRVIWQHALTPEQAVAVIQRHMQPQIDRVLGQAEHGQAIDVGAGPLHAVKPGEAQKYYVELDAPDGASQGFVVEPDKLVDEMFGIGPDEDDPMAGRIPRDPRDE